MALSSENPNGQPLSMEEDDLVHRSTRKRSKEQDGIISLDDAIEDIEEGQTGNFGVLSSF